MYHSAADSADGRKGHGFTGGGKDWKLVVFISLGCEGHCRRIGNRAEDIREGLS